MPSEAEQTKEYEPTYPLPHPLNRFQDLIDPAIEEPAQPVGGGCGTANCTPGDQCQQCVHPMAVVGRSESWLVNILSYQGQQPSVNHEEAPAAVTWQLILAAQQADAIVSYFTHRILGIDQDDNVDTDECADEFKVLSSQFKHLSVSTTGPNEVPEGVLFFKDSRIVAPAAIRAQLIVDAHGTGHVGITKTYNSVQALYWWPAMWRDVKRAVDQCQTCLMSCHVDPKELAYHPLEVAHTPRQVFYMDLLGPVTGIKSEQRFILTIIDGFSRLLATRPIPNC